MVTLLAGLFFVYSYWHVIVRKLRLGVTVAYKKDSYLKKKLSGSKGPHISIITSVYKGEIFIRSFLEDIVQQTIFDDCELIIINANSPENEEPIIKEYAQKYPNIRYYRLEKDPGLYGVWNKAISLAEGEFITNANVDDRLAPDCYEEYLACLQELPHIDLVYADYVVTHKPPLRPFVEISQRDLSYASRLPDFDANLLKKYCYVGPHPMWRKSVHKKYGYFDENLKISGDWEFWLRMATGGSQFYKIDRLLGLYYQNPKGLSTGKDEGLHHAENASIYCRYSYKPSSDERV